MKSKIVIPSKLYHGTTLSAYEEMTVNGEEYRNILGKEHGVYLDTIIEYPQKTAESNAGTFKTDPVLLIVNSQKIRENVEIHPERDDWYEVNSLNKESYLALNLSNFKFLG